MTRLLLSLLLMFPTALWANADGPCAADTYRAFDFWLGEWRVTVPTGQLAGHNSITMSQQGCLLEESWQGVQGASGQSFNYYDATTEKWSQLWVSPGVVIDISGGLEGSAMVLKGQISYQQNETQFDFIGRWTPNEDGTVTQEFEQWNPETEAWDNWFTGIYTRTNPDD